MRARLGVYFSRALVHLEVDVNLKELTGHVESALQYSPTAQASKDEMARLLNVAYLDLLSEKKWDFLQKDVPFSLYGNDGAFAGSQTAYTITLTAATALKAWEGHTVTYTGSVTRTARIVSAVDGGSTFVVDESFTEAGLTDITIQFARFQMPADTIEALGWMSRANNRGWIPMLDTSSEEYYDLEVTQEGDVETLLLDGPAENITAPRTAPVVAVNASAGSFAIGDVSTYIYTFVGYGYESSRSEEVAVTTTAGNLSNQVDVPATSFFRKRIYRKDANGVYRFISELPPASVALIDIKPALADEDDVYIAPSPVQFVRPWPIQPTNVAAAAATTDDDPQVIRLRYKSRVPRMQHDMDVPMFDSIYHMVLVHKVVEQKAAEFGDSTLAKTHKTLGKELKGRMIRKLTTESARQWVKGRAGVAALGRRGRW